MMAEISGVGMSNKGAELMLCAILDRLRRSVPGIKFVVDPSVGSFADRTKYGLYQKMGSHGQGKLGRLIRILMHGGYRSQYGIVGDREIDAVLDASGFAYGDQWGARHAQSAAMAIACAKRRGKKVVLLPQAFGPFSDREVARAVRIILENSDLVFARDSVSLGHLRSLGETASRVKLAPDFTNLVAGRQMEAYKWAGGRTCVVPNVQMMRMPQDGGADQYARFLFMAVECLLANKLRPFVLLHEEQRDKGIASMLVSKYGDALPSINEPDVLVAKGIMGASRIVVASRFHAIVGALSQGIPCIATSWSHKYGELMKDYSCEDLLVASDVSREAFEEKVLQLTSEPSRSELIRKLRDASAVQKAKSEAMWREVETVLQEP